MNKTTKTQRAGWDAFARSRIRLNADNAWVVNAAEVDAALVKEFGMSEQSAIGCVARAARQLRAAKRGA